MLIRPFILALAMLIASLIPAMAQKRVALVVGISKYQSVPALINPSRDATAMGEVFKKAGFDKVDIKLDLTVAALRREVREFAASASGADIAVVYYAGHGIEVNGTNYLIPADARLTSDYDIPDETFPLDRILDALEPVKRLRLVILDACRDNPFSKTMKRSLGSRSIGRGLARVEPTTSNTLIAFAAKAGAIAGDGEGANSPFATALIKYITTPGLDLRLAFGKVRDDVIRTTNNRQEPFVYGSLGGDSLALVPAIAAAPQITATDNVRSDYDLALQANIKAVWDVFIETHPKGLYTELAKAQRDKLASEAARIAATEKAKAAQEEQTRLAIEGAKKAEQEKAAAEARKAEAQRVAAELAKRAEEEKVAEAEKAKAAALLKAAEEARIAAEKKAAEDAKKEEQRIAAAKAAEETRVAAEKKAAEEAAKAEQQRVAAELAKKAEEAKAAEVAKAKAAAIAKAEEDARAAATKKAADDAKKEEQRIAAAKAAKEAEEAKAAEIEKAKIAAAAKAAEETRVAAEKKAAEEAAKAEQQRVAAELAKKAEEAKAAEIAKAKAAALAKAEEDARAAAAKKAADDAKKEEQRIAAAKAAKEAEEAKAAEIEKAKIAAAAKAAEETRDAAERKAAEEAAKAEKQRVAAEQKARDEKPIGPLAALAPEQAAPKTAVPVAVADIPKQLQIELKRVGCNTGAADGHWNAAAQKTLDLFNKNANTKFDIKLASLDALDAVKGKTTRVCPLICERGYKPDGETCSKIVCGAGFAVGANNTCEKIDVKKPDPPVAKKDDKQKPDQAGTDTKPAAGGADSRYAACRAKFLTAGGMETAAVIADIKNCMSGGGASPRSTKAAGTKSAEPTGQYICGQGGCRPVAKGCRLELRPSQGTNSAGTLMNTEVCN